MTMTILQWRKCAVAAALAGASIAAHASLTLIAPEDFSGTGLGNVNTILTLQSPGNGTFESGSVAFGNVISGDAKKGMSQTQTRTLGDLGVTSAASLRVVFNALEPGNGANGITLDNLQLNIYDPSGKNLLFTSGNTFTPVTFADTKTGAGNSGFVFGLDAAQQAQAAAAFGPGFKDNVVTLSASAGCDAAAPVGCQGATGGFETFFVANAAAVAPIPEPSTAALMFAGLGLAGFLGRRRMVR
jgi:hypothetical protein